MNEFVLKLCPTCKLEIIETDDVCVCESCNVAHHKACWEETNLCGNEACPSKIVATPQVADPPKPLDSSKIFCGKCGLQLKETQAFCPRCGTKNSRQTESSPAPAPVGASDEPENTPPASSVLEPQEQEPPAPAVEATENKEPAPIVPDTEAAKDKEAAPIAEVAEKKKFCGKCGAQLSAGQKFCGRCGNIVS